MCWEPEIFLHEYTELEPSSQNNPELNFSQFWPTCYLPSIPSLVPIPITNFLIFRRMIAAMFPPPHLDSSNLLKPGQATPDTHGLLPSSDISNWELCYSVILEVCSKSSFNITVLYSLSRECYLTAYHWLDNWYSPTELTIQWNIQFLTDE